MVQSYGGEECDFGYTFNVLNQNETYRRHDFRPMNVTPPTVCISTCRIEQDETNWYAQHSFQLFEAFSA